MAVDGHRWRGKVVASFGPPSSAAFRHRWTARGKRTGCDDPSSGVAWPVLAVAVAEGLSHG
ncbi:hypothetical protein E2562_025515 [Oryza meyeriana var. granulata]|uniref:Uncharacterized protein n=1 Tax=Oryza meyeriana var. granulata TaxID=110450 RepID=A0A6G1C8V1_9ORYZ|nr:hypothetical protein E2562_025515 [Oryza meyeriana var. granulata]